MKRAIVLILILCALVLLILSFLLPNNNSFSTKIYINTSVNATKRFLFYQNSWLRWWPGNLQIDLKKANEPTNGGYIYSLQNTAYTGLDINVEKNKTVLKTSVSLLKVNNDSVSITWSFPIPKKNNLIQRIGNYFYARHLKKNANEILESLKYFLENTHNVYGININKIMVTDTALIAKKYTSAIYPSTEVIYGLIQQLKKYISQHNAVQTNPPMLNIQSDTGGFKTMVAIPVNKELQGNDSFLLKRMFPGKILVTQVRGGINTTDNALRQLETYIDDYQLASPAIPFESLITDRMEVKDTTRWITKVYYPIF